MGRYVTTTSFIFTLCIVFLFVGCTSVELADEESPQPVPSPIEAPQESSPAPNAKEEEPVQQAPEEGESDKKEEEEYQATKKDLSELVQRLNDIISNNNYEEWLNYLTSDYIDYYNDPEVVKKFSAS